MAERRTRHRDSPRRRKRESTRVIIDQDEVPPTRAPYQPAEIPSSYSSSSSSYIDISRTYPPNRPRGLGAIRAFFTSPSERRRGPRRRTSRPYLRGGSSSSSSVNTDLAYGTGYIRRRKGYRRREKGKERESVDRRDPRAERDPDAAIQEVGAGLAALARKQNRLDIAEARRQGIAPPRRSGSSILKGAESSRGMGSSKISHGPDEEGWESATDADSETSSVDSRLAYGHGNGPGWGGFFRSRPKRKDSVVDPALFGPANSLHGIVHEPVGFEDVDYDNLSDYPPPTIAALQKEQGYTPQVPAPQREQSIASGSTSATAALQYVYPVPTSDPTRFDAANGSVVSAQEPYGSRPAPVPIQQAPVEIQQPQPKPIVSQSVFEPPYSIRSEPKVPSSSGRSKPSVAGAALAGVTGAVIGAAAASSDRRDERKDRNKGDDGRDQHDGDRRAERQKDELRERPGVKDGADDHGERRRQRNRDGADESREERRERRRREKRDDPDYERREKRREKRRDDVAPDDKADKRYEDKYTERPDNRDDERRTRKDAPIVAPVDPFQYQVADDAFKTPDGTRNSEPFTSIQRARSPAVITVERVPHWHRDASTKEDTVNPCDDIEQERDRDDCDRKQTEREAESLYEEIEHSTIPVEASAVSAAIAAEEHRHSREKVRKRRYDRSGDASPTSERDPIQEEADRIYREAVLARKIAESKNEDPVVRVVTPPEMAHKKEKEVLYPVPNADFELDHVMDPMEFMTSPIKGPGEGFDRIKSLSGVAPEDLKRPLLTLVRPTPTPSPAPEEQKSRSKRKDSSRESEPSEPKRSESGRKESSRDEESAEQRDNRPERKRSSKDQGPPESREKPVVDTVITEARGDASQTPTSANGTKGVTWGENNTKHYEVESPYEIKDDPIATSMKASDNEEKPKMSKERKASAWGALRGAFMSGAAAEVVAKATETSKNDKDSRLDRRDKNVKLERTEREDYPEKKEVPGTESFQYRGVVVETEHSDNETREQGPPAVGPKPSKVPGSNMPGAFEEDIDFTANLAAGLQVSGFDPNIVIEDPTYRRRSSPPGSEDPPLTGYKQPYAETVSDLGKYVAFSTEKSRDIKAQDADPTNYRTETEQKKLDKAAKRQSNESGDRGLSEENPVSTQLVEKPEPLESSKSSKKEKKRDKTKKPKDSFDEADVGSDRRVSIPVDAFDDLYDEAVPVEASEDWETPKKSKKKSKRDSGQYDSPSRSMSASDITSSVEVLKKKSKDKSSKRSPQYDSEPNPEDIPLPSASEISRDDEYDSRKSKRSSKRSSSIPDVTDRDTRSVKSDSSRYADEDDSRSGKKEKRSSGFFSGIFGSSTGKSEPERPKDAEDLGSKKKSKKSKRSSIGDSSEIHGSEVKSDVKSSPNGNGYNNYDDDDDGDPNRSMNGDSKHGKTDEKKESFLDNAGTLGAGVGLAAAIALVAQHQQSKAATSDIEERVHRKSTPERASPTETPTVEASREMFEEDIVDPEIFQRQIRPSIDPQYGDLLPLPPSDPGSPIIEDGDALPPLPEDRPNTPPRVENVTTRERSVGSSKRSELPALVKTPSHSAVPIKFIMGNRSTPSSPGLVRAPSVSSPSTMSPETLGPHRARPRPTSWDNTKEIQPLYLLEPNRRAPASQSTDSEVQSPVAEDVAKSTQIESILHESEATQQTQSTDIRDFTEGPELEHYETHVQEDLTQDPASAIGPAHTALPPSPKTQTSLPMGRVIHDSELINLPPLPKSGTATPADSSGLSTPPQLPDSRASASAGDRSVQDSDPATAGLLTGAAFGLSTGALALVSNHDEAIVANESAPEPTSTEGLPAEFQVEPITKDRSSYLFQATPPTKRTKHVDTESLLETEQSEAETPSHGGEKVSSTHDVTGLDNGSPTHVVEHEREATLEALTRSKSEEEEPLGSVASPPPTTAKESEVDAADEFSFTKSRKNKKKDKKNRADQFGFEDEPSSSTITPASIAEPSKDIEGPPEFLVKKSKKDKKDKKRASSQWDTGDEPPESIVLAPGTEAIAQERDIIDEPSQSSSTVVPLSSIDPALEEAGTVEKLSPKKSKKAKKDKKKASNLVEPEDEGFTTTALPVPVPPSDEAVDPIAGPLEPLEPLPATILLSNVEPSSVERTEKCEDRQKGMALDFDDSTAEASASATVITTVASDVKELETVHRSLQPLLETTTSSSVEPVNDFDTPAEFSVKSKKDKKKDKKKALAQTEGGDDVPPITVLPSSVTSGAQEADPSDEYSSNTSKKDKKKDKKNRKSLSRSSTLVEPSIEEPVDIVDAKGEYLSIAEQTPLPVSRALSEAETMSEVSEVDVKTRDGVQGEEGSPPLPEQLTEPASAKEVKKSKKKGRKSVQSWELEDPSISEAAVDGPNIEVPLQHKAYSLGLEPKDIIENQVEPQIQPRAETLPIEESKNDRKSELQQNYESKEPLVPEPVEELTKEELIQNEPARSESLRDESVTGEQVQEEISGAQLEREMPLLDNPVRKETVGENIAGEPYLLDEPIREELGNRDIDIKDPRTTNITIAQDMDQSKPVEPIKPVSESGTTKDSKKSKKKKGKSVQAWQDDEWPESQPNVNSISEPTTAAPSEREDLSGFSTSTSKSKGKKKQKRKSIAWDVQEPEPESALEAERSIPASDSTPRDAQVDTNLGKESADLPQNELGEPITISKDNDIKEELGRVPEPEPRQENTPHEPEVQIDVIEKSQQHVGQSDYAARSTESELFDTAHRDSSGLGYLPSAAALHSPRVTENLKESVETGYFPSAVRVLPAATPFIAMATSSLASKTESIEQLRPGDVSPSTTTARETVAEQLSKDGHGENTAIDEPSNQPRDVSTVSAKPLPLADISALPEPVITDDVPKQTHIEYFLPTSVLHPPSSARPSENESDKGYVPSTTAILPPVGAAAVPTREGDQEEELFAKEGKDDKVAPSLRTLEYDKQALPTTDHMVAETINPKEAVDSRSEPADEKGADSKPFTPYSEEQLEAARRLNAEFGPGNKKSKKNKKGRTNLSRTSTQDEFSLSAANEPEETEQQIESNREIQDASELQTADGLAAGYKEDQVALAKQLQAEFDFGSKKSKKGKKNRSASRTPQDYDSSISFFAEPEATSIQPAEEVSHEITPEDANASKKQGPDGLAVGFTEEQLETARQIRDSLASGSKKSKKEKKRKGLIRSATDENISGPATEGGSEETSLATTEIDSASESPYPLSIVPTADDFESSFTGKKGKKGKKRQSLLRSFTQDSEESGGPGREIPAESETVQPQNSEREVADTVDTAPELVIDPLNKSSSAIDEEPEPFSFSTKKSKKGKKRQSLLSTATHEESSFDPASGVGGPEPIRKDIAEATTSQPPDIAADNDMPVVEEEHNFSSKKSKKDKKDKKEKGKEINNILTETGNGSAPHEKGTIMEQSIAPRKEDPDQSSLADRIWADAIPTSGENLQPETENPSAESEDPLGLYTTKKSKKNKKKGQAKSILTSELETVPADPNARAPIVSAGLENKELQTSWADEVAEAEVKKKQPPLFDTWSFANLPLDEASQEVSVTQPQAASKGVEVGHDIRHEKQTSVDYASSLPEDGQLGEAHVHEQEKSTTVVEPVEGLETPPPAMPSALAWEDEPILEPQAVVNAMSTTGFSARETEGRDEYDVRGKTTHSEAKPVSTAILAAGAALLTGVSMGQNESTELLPTGVARSAAENNEANTSISIESDKKRQKRPAKLLDRQLLSRDDLFDDPMLWEGAEAQKFSDHAIGDQSGDDAGFWSAPVEKEERIQNEFAVDDVEEALPSMPHKRERSESLMEVWEPSTHLDHIKTPRKHQYEDIPTAIARDVVMEQEIAEEEPMKAGNQSRDVSEDASAQTDKSIPVAQWNDIADDILTPSSKKKSKKDKKQSRRTTLDTSAIDEAGIGSSHATTLAPSVSRDINADSSDDQRTSVSREASKDHESNGNGDMDLERASSSALPFVGQEEGPVQRSLDEARGHGESAKQRHRSEEIYLPPLSSLPRATEDENVLQRDPDINHSELPSDGRSRDKHRRQESYLPPASTLPVVMEEEDHKPESEHARHERGISDNNRDSAFVTESPVPFQRRIPEDHEYARDSGVHLRDWGDAPVTKDKTLVTSADDALARLSWPPVDEEGETVDLKQSQRPKHEGSPKGHAASPAVVGAGAVTVTELAHLAARSPLQKRDEHGENAKFDRSITPNMGRLQTPDHSRYRPGSVGSNRSSGTPPLRRTDRKLSGDLRSLSQRSQANLAKEAKDSNEFERSSPATSIVNINPTANEGRPRVKDMADVYDGYGEGRIGSPMSPTRPHSMRRRQSMQVLDLEARLEQLAAENRTLAEAKELAEHSLQSSQRAALALADRDAEVDTLKQTLDWLHREVERLKEVNDGLESANVTLGRQHNERYGALESQHADATRELEDLRQSHGGLSGEVEDVVMERVAAATQEKDAEIAQLRQDLEAAHERIREMQRDILRAKDNNNEFLVLRDEDYFDSACQQLCQHVQQWVLRFSKFSDMRACRRTNEINNDKIIDRLDNAVLDGSDVDEYLSDRVKRRDIFMSMTMTMIWEFVFTRYLFGMDREQRQKLKTLEKTLLEVGPPAAVHQWRATTLTLLSRREAFQRQREQDTVAVVQMIFQTLSEILPPPSHLEEQIQEQLMRVMKAAVDLSIEMRTQRAEYMMLPPLQPEYDANGDLARQVQFTANLMNERSGDTVSNEELEAQHAVVRIVLFPLVVKKGDDAGDGDDEIVVCPAQVLVAKPKRYARGLTPEGMGQNSNHSRVSMQSSMPVDQNVPDF